MDDPEGCLDSLSTAAVAGKDSLKDLVAANKDLVAAKLALAKTVANLNDTNAHLVKKVESWINGGGDGGGGGGRGNCPKGKWYNNCKHKTWHKEGKYFKLGNNKSMCPGHWKLLLCE